mgnify:CR=1 FL=1
MGAKFDSEAMYDFGELLLLLYSAVDDVDDIDGGVLTAVTFCGGGDTKW